jgi:ribokinase
VPARLTVVGSINLDLVAQTARLPRAGETVTDATFARIPGGKGANQAVAAARLGADVALLACVGSDELATTATSELERAGVDLKLKRTTTPTGVALIVVDDSGENTIVVAPGANAELRPEDVDLPECDGILCQLEIPLETVMRVAETATAEFFLNAAPARGAGTPKADVTIVNQYELDVLPHRDGVLVVTHGAEGAVLLEDGVEVARAVPPKVDAVDGTAAGDAFTACLVVSLLEGRDREEALRRACIAGALAASKLGAQTSLPTAEEVDGLL